jgi:hypothetical protein
MPDALMCPTCDAGYDAVAVFSNCHSCQTEERYFAFTCPQCGDHAEVRVDGGFVMIGGPDGFPEPSFREHSRLRLPGGFSVSWERNGAAVRIGDQRWTFRPAYYRY